MSEIIHELFDHYVYGSFKRTLSCHVRCDYKIWSVFQRAVFGKRFLFQNIQSAIDIMKFEFGSFDKFLHILE